MQFLPVALARQQAVLNSEVNAKYFLSPVPSFVFLHCTVLFTHLLLLQHGSPVSCSPSGMSLSCHESPTDNVSLGCPAPPGASCSPAEAHDHEYWAFFQNCLSSYVHKNYLFFVSLSYFLSPSMYPHDYHFPLSMSEAGSQELPFSFGSQWDGHSSVRLDRFWKNMCNDFFF